MELKKYKLGEFIENYGDGIHGTPKYDTNGDYYFINGNNLLDGKITINDNTLKVSENEYQKIYRPIINGRTILISINGTLGRLAIYRGEKICLGKSACYINLKDSKYISFILYVLKSKEFSIYMNRVAGQSTIKNVSPKQIINYEFFAPKSLENCLNFGNLLSALDQKIALNRKINDNLEAMAKQLYDYWFVQFDFPNKEGKPYKSSGGKMVWNEKLKQEIPDGWEDTTLGEFCTMYQPQTIRTEVLCTDGKYRVYGANGIVGYYNKFNHEHSEIAMACRGNSCGTLNRTMPFSWITGNAMVIQLKDSQISNEYIKQALAYMNIKGVISGSGQPQLTRENLKSVKCLKPSKNILHSFSSIILPIVEKQLNIINEIETLTKQRDELLPLLMNGQVSVNYD